MFHSVKPRSGGDLKSVQIQGKGITLTRGWGCITVSTVGLSNAVVRILRPTPVVDSGSPARQHRLPALHTELQSLFDAGREYDHSSSRPMQALLHRYCGVVVQEPMPPGLIAEDELAGEEH